ncbi:MAG: MFS transporter [Gallicola sp.]|nr:MFS transporter [Gallicola sp.]
MNKRWLQLGIGTIMMLFLGLIYAWSIFRGPLMENFPVWSTAEISLTFTIAIVSFCLGIIIAGKILGIAAARWVLLASGILNFIGFIGVSALLQTGDPSGSLIKLYLLYGVLCGFGVGMGYNAVLSATMGWFPDKSGLASGILLMGFGLGGLVLGSIIGGLIQSEGIFAAFRIIGFAFILVSIIVSFFIKKPSAEDRAVLPAGKRGGSFTAEDHTAKEMISSGYFWFFYFWQISVAAGGLLVINSAVPIAGFFGASAVVGLIVSIFNGAGRVLIGMIFDKLGNKALLINALILLGGGGVLTLTALTNNGALLWIGLPMIGIAYGGAPALCSAIVRTRWGAKHYPVNFGFASTNLMFGAFLGPFISGGLQDLSGNFTSTFFMLLAFGTAAILLSLKLIRERA